MGGSQSVFDYDQQLMTDQSASQTVEFKCAEEKGYGAPRQCHAAAKSGMITGAVNPADANAPLGATLWDCFQFGKSFGADNEFLGTRLYKVAEDTKDAESKSGYVTRADGSEERFDYVWDTYGQVEEASINVGRALIKLGLKANANVGIFSINRSEWVISSFGIYSQTMRTVPLYATLGPDAVEYIITHAETSAVFVSPENLKALKKVAAKVASVMKHVIVFDPIFGGRYGNTLTTVNPADVEFFEKLGITLVGMSAFMATGEAAQDVPVTPPTGKDLAFVMYTSGTTGVPKGAMLSHENVVSVAGAIKSVLHLEVGDVHFSYLPLAHIFETSAQAYVWTCGGRIAFFQGDPRRLVDDIRASRPALFCGVPRVFSRFYQNFWDGVAERNFIARWFVRRAFDAQCDNLRNNRPLDPSHDGIFQGVRARIGFDRIKCLITGAAPCPPYIVEFMRVLTGAYFTQGYGMTEASAGTAVSLYGDNNNGTVGPPLPCNIIRLEDIPEMQYLSTDENPRGEIHIHGPNVFLGYYKNEEATAEALYTDSEGRKWLRTGDVGRWNPNGSLSIIDRKKNIIKLQQGEYVAIENVEDVYSRSSALCQIWCYGNSYKTMLVGVLVPNVKQLYEFAKAQGFISASDPPLEPSGSVSEPLRNLYRRLVTSSTTAPAIEAWLAGELKANQTGLHGFQQIKKFYIEPEIDGMGLGFTEANDCLTPTMKKRRKQLTDRYIEHLKRMYTELKEPPASGDKW